MPTGRNSCGWGDGQAVGEDQPPKGIGETPRSGWGLAKTGPWRLAALGEWPSSSPQPVQSWEVPPEEDAAIGL